MSGKIKDGGPAFPCPHESAPNEGMTLRNYFAGQALAGMLANPTVIGGDGAVSIIANCAYKYADAMIKTVEAEP